MPPIPYKQFIANLRRKATVTGKFNPESIKPRQSDLPGIEPAPKMARFGKDLKNIKGELDPSSRAVTIRANMGNIGKFSFEVHNVPVEDVQDFLYDGIGLGGEVHALVLDHLEGFFPRTTRSIRFYYIKYFEVEDHFRDSNVAAKALKAAFHKMNMKRPAVVIFHISASDKRRQAALVRWYRQVGFKTFEDYESGDEVGMEVFT